MNDCLNYLSQFMYLIISYIKGVNEKFKLEAAPLGKLLMQTLRIVHCVCSFKMYQTSLLYYRIRTLYCFYNFSNFKWQHDLFACIKKSYFWACIVLIFARNFYLYASTKQIFAFTLLFFNVLIYLAEWLKFWTFWVFLPTFTEIYWDRLNVCLFADL